MTTTSAPPPLENQRTVVIRRLIILGDQGDLVLAEASPAAYTEQARWKALPRGPCWTGPALADGRLYLRNETALVAVDLVHP